MKLTSGQQLYYKNPSIGDNMKKKILLLFTIILVLTGCRQIGSVNTNEMTGYNNATTPQDNHMEPEASPITDAAIEEPPEELSLIIPEGTTLESRITTPAGYTRTFSDPESFSVFVRNYPMKDHGSPVLLYDGREKGNQRAHAAVFALPIENYDLQQCADSVMRLYAEYFRQTNQPEKIAFHFVSGFYADYPTWRDGSRIQVNGNQVSWVPASSYNDSYETFQSYLRMVFSYASTLSMEKESSQVSLSNAQTGDVFLQGGSPGHVVMIVDVCENEAGQKAFLLAQGYMPAQEFHLLNNPSHEQDPWYYEDEISYPFHTPEYTFQEGSLKRLVYDSQ